MSSEWPLVAIENICELIVDCVNKTAPVVDQVTPYRMIRTTNVRNGRINLDECRYVEDDTYKTWTRRAQLRIGDVILTREAPIGEVGLVTEAEGVFLGQRLMQYRANPSVLDSRYLLYSFLSPALQHQFNSHEGSGSVVSHIRVGDCFKFKLRLPPLTIQREIAVVLGAIDDRIALLRETNDTLESIAQALFKSWFVDFDPVRAKMEGRAPEGMDEATAALFPDSFEESELGLVPKGWDPVPLSNVVDFKEGPGIRNWQYTNTDEGTRFINIRCIQAGDLTLDSANRISDEEANGKYAHFHLAPWDIVVSTSGTLGRSAIVREEHLPLMLNTSVIRFRPMAGKAVFSYLHQYLNGAEFLYKLESMASGSVQKNFGPMHLKQIQLLCPSFPVLEAYEAICRPLYEEVVANRAHAQTLITLRDTLLPRLISGQLRLPEINKVA